LILLSPAAAGAADHLSGKVDPTALAALKKMSVFLQTQRAFGISAEMSTDDLLPNGQKVKYEAVATLTVRRPDGLRVDVTGDRRKGQFFYDGHSFTAQDLQTNYYATFAAPPTLAGVVDVAERRYGVDLPLADLFAWSADPDNAAAITSAVIVGASVVRGMPCTHYAFREADVDWQVWISQGDKPLPRKVVITTVTEKSQPEHELLLTWDLSPRIGDGAFTFKPAAGAQHIDFAPLSSAEPRRSKSTTASAGRVTP
jgi:hypothetical protein